MALFHPNYRALPNLIKWDGSFIKAGKRGLGFKILSFISEDEVKAAVYEDEFILKAIIKDLNRKILDV